MGYFPDQSNTAAGSSSDRWKSDFKKKFGSGEMIEVLFCRSFQAAIIVASVLIAGVC